VSAPASAYSRLVVALHEHGSTVRGNGVKAQAQCPSHDDKNPSLTVTDTETRALVHCHAGCATSDVLTTLNLTMRDLYNDPAGAKYNYTDRAGSVLRTVHRTPNKKFRQTGQTKGTAPLYRLPQVAAAIANNTVIFVVEGEADVHAMESLGAVATTSPMGASNAHKADWTPLHGAHIIVVPDQDTAGLHYLNDVISALDNKAATLRVKLPVPGCKDAADHIAAGHGLDELVETELPKPGADKDATDDAAAVEILPAPSAPMAVARVLMCDFTIDDCQTLRSWRGGWMRWQQSHWADVEEAELRATFYRRLENAEYVDETTKTPKVKPWGPNRHKVADVLAALAAVAHLPESIDPPSWLVSRDESRLNPLWPTRYEASQMVACTNGLLHVGTRKLVDLTPRYFNRVAVPFDYDAATPWPARWLAFLDELWPDDPDSIKALQEFFGYVLSGRTDLHKILLLIGPPRSGKGTIARVLAALVGKGNAAGPTLASLGTNFGLQPLLGKPLAVVSDARLGGASVHQVVERLLSVFGEDMLTVDRKYREPWTGKLPTRFLVLSNELPRFGDASGAIAHRFIVTTMYKSFLGRENTKLTGELLTELPGILRWALDGLDRLAAGSAFTEPASSTDAIIALQDLVSPVAAFVRDVCTVGAGHEVGVTELYTAWKQWAEDNGHRPGSQQVLGRDLRAVVPQLQMRRPREGVTQTRRYFGISLSAAHNGFSRDSSRLNPADDLPTSAHNGADRGPSRTSREDDLPAGTCPRCQQPNTPLTGHDRRGRLVCTDCAYPGGGDNP